MRVLQLIDTLEAGGAERLAINLANVLVDEIDKSFLCATRAEGILKATISKDVGYLFLEKKKTLDLRAVTKLKSYINKNDINIIHAHSTSFFLATLVKFLMPKLQLIWHDHYGESESVKKRPKTILKICSRYFNHVFCVNQLLLNWGKENLKCNSVTYLQNIVLLKEATEVTYLKGEEEKKILCLANLRPQKDHFTLLKAFEEVVKKYPKWTLHLVGKDFKDAYSKEIKNYIYTSNLQNNVFLYGSCPDIKHILSQSNIGVLSSKSEGLPIALLEYGIGKLAVVATNVGDCKMVVDSSQVGTLVKPQSPIEIQNALISYIKDEKKMNAAANALHKKVEYNFSKESILVELLTVYKR